MKICVAGLWHLGSVTAACLAQKGFDVIGWDPSTPRIAKLSEGKAPLFEPGLDDLLSAGLKKKRLSFTANAAQAVSSSDLLWVTFDTPVNDDDQADVESVRRQIISLFDHLKPGTPVIVSSQLPVGTCATLEAVLEKLFKKGRIPLCCSPENLRLGKAIEVFQNPDRIVAGIRAPEDKKVFAPIFSALCDRVEWMTTESAEMTKHAINSFLAASIVFANELAVLCESVGADAKEVERGLKTESRIGPKAYVKPGAAFAGGTLARDVQFLTSLGRKQDSPAVLLRAILDSNQVHKKWAQRMLQRHMKTLKGARVAVLGLTYKEGTDTLRRSWSVELSRWLHHNGAQVQAFDWQCEQIPAELSKSLAMKASYASALEGSDALIVGTDHPDVRRIPGKAFQSLRRTLIIDPNGCLDRSLVASLPRAEYFSVGFSSVDAGGKHER